MKILDESVLEQLQQDINLSVFNNLLEMFIEEAQERLGHISTLSVEAQWQKIRVQSHTLKSLAGSFGLARLGEMARQLDESCQKENYDLAKSLSQQIPQVGEESLKTLQHWMEVRA